MDFILKSPSITHLAPIMSTDVITFSMFLCNMLHDILGDTYMHMNWTGSIQPGLCMHIVRDSKCLVRYFCVSMIDNSCCTYPAMPWCGRKFLGQGSSQRIICLKPSNAYSLSSSQLVSCVSANNTILLSINVWFEAMSFLWRWSDLVFRKEHLYGLL